MVTKKRTSGEQNHLNPRPLLLKEKGRMGE
jgi:hypothetical protein